MLENIARVSEWTAVAALSAAFTGLDVFENIYIPVKTPTANGMPDEFTYTNIGMEYNEIADAYDTLYSNNFLIVPLLTDNLIQSTSRLKAKIQSVYKLNKAKYLKLIELQGYEYNPLYNVDGEETYSYLENEGVNDTTQTKAYAAHTDSSTSGNVRTGSVSGASSETNEDTTQVTSFDSTAFNDTEHNAGQRNVTGSTTTYNSVTDNASGSMTYGAHTDTDTTTITHHNAKNGENDYSGGVDAFGNTVTGGDRYHNEKRIRKGNIGVTKTQELIEAERENLKFSIIQEFFDDLNKVIFVGLYDL